jgi:hypothetical protein
MTATAQDTVEDVSSSRILGEQPVEQLIATLLYSEPARLAGLGLVTETREQDGR